MISCIHNLPGFHASHAGFRTGCSVATVTQTWVQDGSSGGSKIFLPPNGTLFEAYGSHYARWDARFLRLLSRPLSALQRS